MAYHDALFQLGMDLTRSSTAQKEDLGETARVMRAVRKSDAPKATYDLTTERGSLRFTGSQLLVDISGDSKLDDTGHIEQTLRRCAEAAGAKVLHVHLHRTTPHGGVAGVAVLSGSMFSVQTHPESGYAAFDLLMPPKANAEAALEVLRTAFAGGTLAVRPMKRGIGPASRVRPAASATRSKVRKAA